ncbi:DUF1775 domain-containing protein [Rathayibacter toxicus]|uniref:YcnI family copper-binding membrane protein n=1 Tax=Rathayibacter toxicus TaxID=145458 RepID=UPI0009E292CE|nr:YcnI family protein [Rathayibacter toxicus]PPG23032.1 DUF1775 domain-containing protein [Rathayibacter toxicus]PPG47614.1 DUF1775 domain-containing protein [Rathayibacter toxicus]PPH64486.1 DUF1775 domain-containing protein [Rathayibacter toxicus]PPH68678.1 DUF1775 domain-containing protein [Rathayibacter toxicus]PPH73533.1 DUF1775 domain-containing protein [Rathayibacter toxicus]
MHAHRGPALRFDLGVSPTLRFKGLMTMKPSRSFAASFRLRLVGSSVVVVSASIALALSAPTAASAHVTATASSTAAGSYTVVTFAFAHGCEGSPTTGLKITIPEGINSVSPTVNPNWDVTKNQVDITSPVGDSHGNTVTKRVSTVVYSAKTPLADGYRDTVSLQLQLPKDAADKTLEFPVLQTCEVGSTSWDQPTVAGQDEPKLPAPAIAVTAAQQHSGHADAAAATSSVGGDDVVARVLGIGGLIAGAVGVAIALASRRRGTKTPE